MTELRTIKRLLLLVAITLFVLVIVSAVMAGSGDGGGGYCSPLYLRLGGCTPRVACNIGTPQIQHDEAGYYLECYCPPTAPETGK